METFSALLALCVENSPVTGEFPSQRPVTRSFDVFFDLHLNKRLSKQSWGWWFETTSRPLWRHCIAQCTVSTPSFRNKTCVVQFRSQNVVKHTILLIGLIVPNIVVGFKAAIYNVYKNIKRHTLHTIVSWPNPKQWIIVYNRCKNIRSTAFSAAVIIANHPLEFYEYCCYVKIKLSRYSGVVWSWYVSISARYSSHYICYG